MGLEPQRHKTGEDLRHCSILFLTSKMRELQGRIIKFMAKILHEAIMEVELKPLTV